jgi:hypothetical protein
MAAAFAVAILLAVIVLDIDATGRVVRSNLYTSPQKALQIAVVWVIPILGAVVALALAEACSRTLQPNVTLDLMKSNHNYIHSYRHHPDGIRVLIEFRFEIPCDRPVGFPPAFLLFVNRIARQIAVSNPKTLEALLKQRIHGQTGSTVQHMLNIMSQSGGQLVTIVRFERLDPQPPPDPKAPAVAMAVRKA